MQNHTDHIITKNGFAGTVLYCSSNDAFVNLLILIDFIFLDEHSYAPRDHLRWSLDRSFGIIPLPPVGLQYFKGKKNMQGKIFSVLDVKLFRLLAEFTGGLNQECYQYSLQERPRNRFDFSDIRVKPDSILSEAAA